MRTTLNIEDKAYKEAFYYAKARDISLGKAVGELILRAIHPEKEQSQTLGLKKLRNGMLVLPSRGKKITPELVKQILEEEFD